MSPGITLRPRRSIAARRGAGQAVDVLVRADGHNLAAANGDGLRNGEALVDRDDLAVGENEIGGCLRGQA